jgi:DNA repair protein RadC
MTSPARRPADKRVARTPAQLLRETLAAYGLNRRQLRQLASQPAADLRAALREPDPPAELLALLDLQIALLTPPRREPVRGPADVAALLMLRMGALDQEQLVTICLDAHTCIQEIALIYQGSLTRAVVRPVEIFKPAIRRNSCGVIIAHNHPSGAVEPSPEDLALTYACIQLGQQLDIALADHLIIGAGRWVSVQTWLKQAGVEQLERSVAEA